jgi:hypothetical protein
MRDEAPCSYRPVRRVLITSSVPNPAFCATFTPRETLESHAQHRHGERASEILRPGISKHVMCRSMRHIEGLIHNDG